MKFQLTNIHTRVSAILVGIILLFSSGCNKILEIPLPTDNVAGEAAFQSDNSTAAVVTGIYFSFYRGGFGAVSSVISGAESVGKSAGLYTDELQSILASNVQNQAFYTNNVQNGNISQWAFFYKTVYQSNLAIQGIERSGTALIYRDQWLGEALFTRAFSYYYLVNLFGDVPLIKTPDLQSNSTAARTPKAEVYKSMIDDLTRAIQLLPLEYRDNNAQPSTLKIRPNRLAASALLARIYLELQDWTAAETQATAVIASTAPKYQLVPPAQTFLAASQESIWSISPTAPEFVREYSIYINNIPATGVAQLPTAYGVLVTMSPSLVSSFETGDLRASNWIRTFSNTNPGTTYYLPAKYKSNLNGTEQVVVLRLAEQYLIRAEARARLGNLINARADLDAVRSRAALNPSPAGDQEAVLAAILKERRVELFTEFGFRFIDLKRTGQIDAVMTALQSVKGSVWSSYKQIWPIPLGDLQSNPNLKQAPGYQ